MVTQRITEFQGEYRFLSNFWPARVQYAGITFPSVEHAYQAAKCVTYEEALTFAAIATPGQAKRAGRYVNLRPDWDRVKVMVMLDLVTQKFAHPETRRALVATGSAWLVEGNRWGDTFWGVCNGEGFNMLGQILMHVRGQIGTQL